MTTDKYELPWTLAGRHPERSEGSTLSVNVRSFPWILRTAQDDGGGEFSAIRPQSVSSVVKKRERGV